MLPPSVSPSSPPPIPHRKSPARSAESRTRHVLLITTGSVASVKAPLIVKELLKYEHVQVQVASTKPSLAFFSDSQVEEENEGVRVWTDDDEWSSWSRIGDPILHIELRRWADILLIAPCSANTLSKLASGACDNLVITHKITPPSKSLLNVGIQTSVLRATSPTTPTYLFPAMNTQMYLHPLTASHLTVASETLGYTVVGPIGKGLACGDTGTGAMTEWLDVVQIVVDRFGLAHKVTNNTPP